MSMNGVDHAAAAHAVSPSLPSMLIGDGARYETYVRGANGSASRSAAGRRAPSSGHRQTQPSHGRTRNHTESFRLRFIHWAHNELRNVQRFSPLSTIVHEWSGAGRKNQTSVPGHSFR